MRLLLSASSAYAHDDDDDDVVVVVVVVRGKITNCNPSSTTPFIFLSLESSQIRTDSPVY